MLVLYISETFKSKETHAKFFSVCVSTRRSDFGSQSHWWTDREITKHTIPKAGLLNIMLVMRTLLGNLPIDRAGLVNINKITHTSDRCLPMPHAWLMNNREPSRDHSGIRKFVDGSWECTCLLNMSRCQGTRSQISGNYRRDFM